MDFRVRHRRAETTMIYTHVLNRGSNETSSAFGRILDEANTCIAMFVLTVAPLTVGQKQSGGTQTERVVAVIRKLDSEGTRPLSVAYRILTYY